VKLREFTAPLRDRHDGKRIGIFIALEHEGTEVEQDFRSDIPGAGSSSGMEAAQFPPSQARRACRTTQRAVPQIDGRRPEVP